MLEGGCRCGAVRYTLALEDMPPVYACHCYQCQRGTGSAFNLQAMVPEDALSVTGPVLQYARTTDDHSSEYRLCGECYSRLYSTTTRRPGNALLRAGTLDRSEEIECRAHIFTASKQRWVQLPEGVPAFEGMPKAAVIMAALGR
jgi:hypothetical protein